MWIATAVAILVALTVAALPMIASTQIVRDRIALEMSALSGYRVELGTAPDIRIWPFFGAVLNNVSLSDWDDPSHQPVLDAESIELELSPIAALSGNVVISSAKLVRPLLYVSKTAPNRYAPVTPKIGRIWRGIEGARAALDQNSTNPDLSALADDSLGTVEFSDGQVVDQGSGPLATGLGGTIEWNALNRGAGLAVSGIWRGENFSFNGSTSAPLILLAGGSAPVNFNLKAAPASGSFQGLANLSKNWFLDGQTTFNSPSLRRMIEWSRNDLPPGAFSGSLALSGRISGDRNRVKLDDARITLDTNTGSGVLELSLTERVPAIAGTLAFDQLDLRSFLSAFTPFTPGSGRTPLTIDVAFAERYNLDLRLSAGRATAGELVFTNVAATAQVKDDLTAFDISDATIFGGIVQAGVRYDRGGEAGTLDVKLLASDIDTAAAAPLARSLRIAPVGKATISLLLKGPGHDWHDFLGTAAGSFSATFGPGTVNGFDIADFINRTKRGSFFALSDVAPALLTVDRAEVRATLADGAARLEKAEAQIGSRTMTLSGVVPYVVGGVALSGAVIGADAAADKPDDAEASFFVGGSWSTPFVAPSFAGSSFTRARIGQSD